MKRIFALFLAASLMLGTISAPARAAEEPSFQVTEEESGLLLEMTGLDDAYCGIQFTVDLTSAADASFEVDDALFRTRPSLYSTYVRSGASVTVYIVAKSPLNDSGQLRLGILHTDASASSVSDIRLLTLEDLEGQTFGSGSLTTQPGTSTQPDGSGTNTPSGNGPSGSGRPSNPDPTSYRIELPARLENGTVQLSAQRAEPGERVTVTVHPAEGYVLEDLTVATEKGDVLRLTDLGDGRYSFVMPEASVTVRASFVEDSREEDPASPAVPSLLPFLDVPERMWYYDAVSYAYGAGLMGGVSASTFDPEGFTTRGQIVTILHRLEGTPPAMDRGGFTDVPAGEWYAAAVDWAAEEGIVDGFGDGRFGPLENVTREQLAAILCRYARSLGVPEPVPGDLTGFADYDKVSPWALESMAWANGLGLINGKTGNLLDPTGNATRAEIATILMRFCENVLPKG